MAEATVIDEEITPQELLSEIGGWQGLIPEDLTYEQDGKPVKLRDAPFVKDSPDFSTFVKRAHDAHREFGARVPLKVSKPEEVEAWRRDHLPKLYSAGILQAPPAKPEEYGIAKPEKVPEGFGWNDDLSKELAATLHRHGAPKALAPDLLGLYEKALLGAQDGLKTSFEQGMAALKTEHGDKFDERMEVARRFTPLIFKTPEEVQFFEGTGLGNHPAFLSIMMRLAPLAMQDSSFVRELSRPAGDKGADEAKTEYADILQNKENPKHKLYWAGDKATLEYVQGLFRAAHPGEREL